MEDAACAVVARKRRERPVGERGEIMLRHALVNSAVRSEVRPRGKIVESNELGPDGEHRSLADKLDFSGRYQMG